MWGLKLPTLRQRLFRCVSIRENDDGTYAITAVQHVPEKEAIVDNGAHFDGDQSGTVNGVTPLAVQHLTAEVTADSGEYQVLARWDTPKVVKGRELPAPSDRNSGMTAVSGWVSTARTTENHIPLHATGAGELQADSPGGKCVGAAGRSGVGIVPDCRTGSTVED
ncbi:tail component of prophage [Escherichia coli]|uniref:Tail component of prophage n=1 Tax=Escherichia coli TaxID=562 RepID=A0A376YEI1_ECOLX|nr:tail component of prophage [Escherichia coli]